MTSLRVMTMNVENLFSPGNTFYGAEHTPEEYRDKVNWSASRIAQCQVHVVGLVEIGEEPQTVLNDLLEAIRDQDPTGGVEVGRDQGR
jgi:hypothetical protein